MRKISALLAMMICTPALAEVPLDLPETVITATRVPTLAQQIPAGVTVIDRATMEEKGFNTISDALASVPGLRVSASGGPGGQTSVFVRGSNSNHVLVLRDGMPINDPSEPSGGFNFGVDTLSDIERIEIIRGPMAALYGSGAIGGVINLISTRGTKPGPHVTTDMSGGYPEQVRGAASLTGVDGKLDYALTVESQSQRGFDSTPQRMTAYTGTPQGFRDRIGTVNLGFTPVDGTRLSLFIRARQALFSFNTLGTPTYDTANSQGSADSLLGRIGVTSALFKGAWDTSLFFGHQREDRHYVETLAPADPNQTALDNRYHTRRTDLQWNNSIHLDRFINNTTLSDSSVTLGYQHLADTITVRAANVFGGYPFAQGAHASSTTDAIHTGLQTTVWQRLTLTGQIRQDWIDTNAPLTWRVGSVFDASEISTRFKLAYGTSFRVASLFDRFGVDSFGYLGNPTLKPEQTEGWEIGFTSTLPGFGQDDFVTFGTTYFQQSVRNLIVNVYSPVYTSVNIGSARMQGFETELGLHPAAWLSVHLNHTYTEARDGSSGRALLRRPRHGGSLDATVMPMAGLKIVPSVEYTGVFRDALYDNGGNYLGNGISPHGLIANVAASYELTPKLRLYATGRNLLGSRFESVNAFQIPGTSVVMGVRVTLD